MDINQIAKMAGVSRATVSRYLNDGYVSKEKRAAIRRVIDETGYVPSRQAQTLRTGKTRVAGVVIPKINSASVGRMVAGISSVLNEAGYQVLLANTDNDPERVVGFLRLFSEGGRVDGVILIGTVFTRAHHSAIASLPVPLVVLDQELAGQWCIYQDDFGALYQLTEQVLERGERPAYIGVLEDDVAAGKRRHEGFLAACRDRGIACPPEAQLVADFSVDAGYTACEQLLERKLGIDTIVCATDSIAYGALTCLREADIAVPEGVQVAGVGDSELSQVITPRLTTVYYHYKTSGIEAAKMLVGLMTSSDRIPREIKMGFEVIPRDSTRA